MRVDSGNYQQLDSWEKNELAEGEYIAHESTLKDSGHYWLLLKSNY